MIRHHLIFLIITLGLFYIAKVTKKRRYPPTISILKSITKTLLPLLVLHDIFWLAWQFSLKLSLWFFFFDGH